MRNLSFCALHLASFFGLTALLHAPLSAQVGDNAVCVSATCSNTTTAPSNAFIDASQYSGSTICAQIFHALQSAPAGAVIDARGINTNLSCNVSNPDTPWQQGTTTVTKSSTIFLPAATISISNEWVMPDRTQIVGEGSNPAGGTQIAVSGTFSDSAMIQMGSSTCPSSQCYRISVENLILEGAGTSVIGILNENAGDSSYVEHVNFHKVEGTCLKISGAQAEGSGPYANLTCGASSSFNANTKCVQLSASSTKGIHGMTCTTCAGGCGQQACCQMIQGPALSLDGSNNTIEDMHFEGYEDGILVGANSESHANAIVSVNGGAGANKMQNVIRISANNSVTDLSIVGATAETAHSWVNVANVIQDDVTNTTIPRHATPPDETTVANYVLGEGFGGGVSRFTTTPLSASPPAIPTSIPSWGAGANFTGTGSCPAGSLFSNTNGGTSTTLYKCTSGTWTAITIQP